MFIVLHGHPTNTCRELRRCGFHDSGLSTFRNDNLLFSFGPYCQATHVLFVEMKKIKVLLSLPHVVRDIGYKLWVYCMQCMLILGDLVIPSLFLMGRPTRCPSRREKHHTKVLEVDGKKDKFASCKWIILSVGSSGWFSINFQCKTTTDFFE